MKVRFQADNDLRESIRIGVIRREPAIDFRSARVAGLDRAGDPDVLRLAADGGRVLVSHDENSMPFHFRQFVAAGNESPGLLMAPQDAPIGLVIESIVLIWVASESHEWKNRCVWIPF